MRSLIALALGIGLLAAGWAAGCARYDDADSTAARVAESSAAGTELASFTDETLEIGCGLCIYGMADVDSCTTAALVDGKPVLVVGTEFDAHEHGLCTAAVNAVVTGAIKNGELVAAKLEVK